LEHLSPERSFYGHAGGLKLPQPDVWIEKLRHEKLLPDLRGVRMTHLTIAMSKVQAGGSNARGFRRHADVIALKHLWERHWQATGAQQLQFGEPLPVSGIQRGLPGQTPARQFSRKARARASAAPLDTDLHGKDEKMNWNEGNKPIGLQALQRRLGTLTRPSHQCWSGAGATDP